jgi:hypothetical protein
MDDETHVGLIDPVEWGRRRGGREGGREEREGKEEAYFKLQSGIRKQENYKKSKGMMI